MPKIKLRNVEVDFPFQPYVPQKLYMERVIEALQTGENALLESPTGTGKTLALLCATIAWSQQHNKTVDNTGGFGHIDLEYETGQLQSRPGMNSMHRSISATQYGEQSSLPSKIIYTSRTHSQLTQVVKELKASAYRPKVSILGSRDQLCVHEKVSRESGLRQNHMCQQLVKGGGCRYYNGVDEYVKWHVDVNHGTDANGKNKKIVAHRNSDGTITTNVNGDNDNNSNNNNSNNMTATNNNNNNNDNNKRRSRLRKENNDKVIRDIEELTKLGKEKDVCPYFLSRNGTVQKQADIFFMPYNYLVDPTVRASLPDIDWQNSVVIIDEAHNLESVCTDSTSFELSAALISVCIKECDLLIVHLRDEMASLGGMTMSEEDLSADDVATLRAILLKIEEDVDNIIIPGNGEKGLTESGAFIYELLAKVNITWDSKEALLGVLRSGVNLFMGVRPNQKCHLEKFLKCMNILFRNGLNPQIAKEAYRTHFYYPVEYGNRSNNNKNKRSTSFFGGGSNNNVNNAKKRRGKTLAFWCFSPGVAMVDIYKLGVRSIILTSGTLSPMDSVESELRLPFKIRLENSHVVTGRQVWVGTLKTGPSKKLLNSSYNNRDKAEYKEELGRTICNVLRQIPNGLLVFFPSYSVMDRCVSFWKENRGGYLWKQIESRKDAFVEPRGSSLFNAMVRNYDAQAKTERGAIFFGVCRGKASEGIDFPDHCARGVIITGIPYAPHKNPQVELKRKY